MVNSRYLNKSDLFLWCKGFWLGTRRVCVKSWSVLKLTLTESVMCVECGTDSYPGYGIVSLLYDSFHLLRGDLCAALPSPLNALHDGHTTLLNAQGKICTAHPVEQLLQILTHIHTDTLFIYINQHTYSYNIFYTLYIIVYIISSLYYVNSNFFTVGGGGVISRTEKKGKDHAHVYSVITFNIWFLLKRFSCLNLNKELHLNLISVFQAAFPMFLKIVFSYNTISLLWYREKNLRPHEILQRAYHVSFFWVNILQPEEEKCMAGKGETEKDRNEM